MPRDSMPRSGRGLRFVTTTTPEATSVASTVAMIHHEIASRYDAMGGLTSLSIAPSTLTPLDERDTLSILVAETRLTSPQGARLPWFIGFFHADGDNTRAVSVREGTYGIWAQTDYREHRTDGIDENAIQLVELDGFSSSTPVSLVQNAISPGR